MRTIETNIEGTRLVLKHASKKKKRVLITSTDDRLNLFYALLSSTPPPTTGSGTGTKPAYWQAKKYR